MTNLEQAEQIAERIGDDRWWTIQRDGDGAYIAADRSRPLKGRYMVTDDDAIRLARAAGVVCDDDGTIR